MRPNAALLSGHPSPEGRSTLGAASRWTAIAGQGYAYSFFVRYFFYGAARCENCSSVSAIVEAAYAQNHIVDGEL